MEEITFVGGIKDGECAMTSVEGRPLELRFAMRKSLCYPGVFVNLEAPDDSPSFTPLVYKRAGLAKNRTRLYVLADLMPHR